MSRNPSRNRASLEPQLSVVLVNTRNPLNIGAAARAMSNFGFSDLRVVQPYEPSFREARSAVGGSSVLKASSEYKSVAEAVADCSLVVGTTSAERRQLQHELKTLEQAAAMIRRQSNKGRIALLFGSEKRGLSNDDLSHCHWLLRIPTREEHGSMNLGQAVAVCLYELALGKKKPKATGNAELRHNQKGSALAEQALLEMIKDCLLEVLRSSGYLKRESSAAAEEKIRRLAVRMGLSAEDAELWLGILRQISWKLKQV